MFVLAYFLKSLFEPILQTVPRNRSQIRSILCKYHLPRPQPRTSHPQIRQIPPISSITLPFPDVNNASEKGDHHSHTGKRTVITLVEEMVKLRISLLVQLVEGAVGGEEECSTHSFVHRHRPILLHGFKPCFGSRGFPKCIRCWKGNIRQLTRREDTRDVGFEGGDGVELVDEVCCSASGFELDPFAPASVKLVGSIWLLGNADCLGAVVVFGAEESNLTSDLPRILDIFIP